MEKIKYLKIGDLILFVKDNKNPEALYGLPVTVVYCKKCVISNQRLEKTLLQDNCSGEAAYYVNSFMECDEPILETIIKQFIALFFPFMSIGLISDVKMNMRKLIKIF